MLGRRRFIRWQINKEAKIKLAGAEVFAPCSIQDLAFNGCQLALRIKLALDTFLKLTLRLCDEYSLEIEAWVAWHKTIDGHNLYGLYFTKIIDSDKEKIYRFILRYCPQEMHRKWWEGLGEEKGGEKMEDRRIFARFAATLPVKFLDIGTSREGLARTQDISAKGMGLVSSEELKAGSRLELWLGVSAKQEPLYTRGEVVWSQMAGPNEYRAGVNLEKADLMGVSRVMRVG